MQYIANNYEQLLGLNGFSELLLKNHFTLYQGYISNLNKVLDNLAMLLKEEKSATPEYAELKRRFGWEYNGVKLHELYFENLTKEFVELPSGSVLAEKLADNFGSVENWVKDFRATGTMRGIGWAVLYFDESANRLFNCWINEHDLGHPAGAKPLLVMDVFEHAYIVDYNLKKADYIESFFKAIDWEIVQSRLS